MNMHSVIKIFTIFYLLLIASTHASAKQLNILATITPIYSLVKNVSGNENNVNLLINSNTSPHHYQLKPSDIKKIKDADVIFAVDKNFEMFLQKSDSIIDSNKITYLSSSEGLNMLPTRSHSHSHQHQDGHHAHDTEQQHTFHDHHNNNTNHEHNHHEHSHNNSHKDHGHNNGIDHNHQHHHHEGCNHGEIDLHFWASPENTIALIRKIAKTLSAEDTQHSKVYDEHAQETISEINTMDDEIKSILSPVKGNKFLVFHDGYQYFEKHYGLKNAGVVSNHNVNPGAKTFQRLLDIIKKENVRCIFAEPQFSPNVINKVAKNARIQVGYLDIEGGNIAKNHKAEDLYFKMMLTNANNFAKCFASIDDSR